MEPVSTQIDRNQIKRAAHNSVPLSVKTYALPHETEVYLEEVLSAFLEELGHQDLKDQLAYCLRELAANAKKANTKRAYFREKGLNLADPDDYERGMKTFKDETLNNIQHYLEMQKDQGLFIKVTFQSRSKTFSISVRNNVEITRKEQIRIYDRIARSRAFKSMEEAFATVLDNSEGAGLGIVILILMLKKMGLSEEAFSIDVENGETIATLNIPFSNVRLETVDMLTQAVLREVESLPQFPDNIVSIQNLIVNPDSEITAIARAISTDVGLTGDLLKLVNSAQFMLPKRVDNIVEAVKLVGMKGIRNLLLTQGTQKILGEKYQDMRALWEHSYRTAFYAYQLARSFKKRKDILDDVYAGGILHDLGKIIVASMHPELLDRIQGFCKAKGIPSSMLEDVSVGFNHAYIGSLIAQRWNFPEQLVTAIRYHHEPTECPNAHAEVVFTVYLANSIADLQRELLVFEQLNPYVLQDFGIQTEVQLTRVSERLDMAFDQQQHSKF